MRNNSVQNRSGNAVLGDIGIVPGALEGCAVPPAACPQRLTHLMRGSPGNTPSPPGDISHVYKWDLMIFHNFPGPSFALPALQRGLAWFPAHTHTHTHAHTRITACLLANGFICQSQFLQPAISITFK